MSERDTPVVIDNPWAKLRGFTDARIALGRAGISLPTKALLEFQLAHAQAQDAVYLPLDAVQLTQELNRTHTSLAAAVVLHSAAENRVEYLQRPDLGRTLNNASERVLTECSRATSAQYDLAIVVVDGLSSYAVQNNTVPMLQALLPCLKAEQSRWSLAPLCIVQQGRVAIGDHIGHLLNARSVLVMIGERPGLSSPDSLGLYLTWNPLPGKTDAERNCISNVRPAGLGYGEASERLMYLLNQSRQLKLTGVNLKDRTEVTINTLQNSAQNFLLVDK